MCIGKLSDFSRYKVATAKWKGEIDWTSGAARRVMNALPFTGYKRSRLERKYLRESVPANNFVYIETDTRCTALLLKRGGGRNANTTDWYKRPILLRVVSLTNTVFSNWTFARHQRMETRHGFQSSACFGTTAALRWWKIRSTHLLKTAPAVVGRWKLRNTRARPRVSFPTVPLARENLSHFVCLLTKWTGEMCWAGAASTAQSGLRRSEVPRAGNGRRFFRIITSGHTRAFRSAGYRTARNEFPKPHSKDAVHRAFEDLLLFHDRCRSIRFYLYRNSIRYSLWKWTQKGAGVKAVRAEARL